MKVSQLTQYTKRPNGTNFQSKFQNYIDIHAQAHELTIVNWTKEKKFRSPIKTENVEFPIQIRKRYDRV